MDSLLKALTACFVSGLFIANCSKTQPIEESEFAPENGNTARPARNPEPDGGSVEAAMMDLKSAPDFEVVTGDGGGLSGYNVLSVRANGDCEYTFASRSGVPPEWQWKRAEFRIAPEVVSSLRSAVEENHILQLNKIYRRPDVADGKQQFIKVLASERLKTVFCYNVFPPNVTSLFEFIKVAILDPNIKQIEESPTIPLESIDWKSLLPEP